MTNVYLSKEKENFKGFPQLTYLNLTYSPFQDRAILRLLRKSPLLTTLILDECRTITGSFCKKIPSKLQSLSLSGCKRIEGDRYFGYLSRLSDLSHLDLTNCNINDAAIDLLAVNCTQLKSLNLSQVGGDANALPSTANLMNLLSKLTSLEDLNLSHLSRVVNDDVCVVIAQLPNLYELRLDGCRLSDVGISHLCKGNLNLRVLSLDDIMKISDEGVIQISRSLLSLEELYLKVCDVTEAGFMALRNLPNLFLLSLIGNRFINDQILINFFEKNQLRPSSNLHNLLLESCPNITQRNIVQLKIKHFVNIKY